MFKNLYLGELKKSFNVKTAIVFALIFLLGFIIVTAVMVSADKEIYKMESDPNYFEDMYGEEIGAELGDSLKMPPAQKHTYTEAETSALLEFQRKKLETLNAQKKEEGYDFYQNQSEILGTKALIRAYEYIQENKLYDEPIALYSSAIIDSGTNRLTSDDYVSSAMGIFFAIIMIYGAVIASGSYANEMKNGTLKLVLMRPVTRNKLTTAKLLSVITISTAAYVIVFIMSVIVGYSAFSQSAIKTLFVFNGTSVTLADRSFRLFIDFACNYVELLGYVTLAFALASLSKERTLGVVASLFIGTVGMLVDMTGLGRFFFTSSIDWAQFAGVNTTVLGGHNFWIALPVSLLYIGGLIAATYCVVNKRDVA